MSRCQSCIDIRFTLFSPSVSLIVLYPVLEFRPSWTLLEVGRASLRVSEMAGAHGSCLSLTRIIFYPRDAMLARYWLLASVSVRLSVTTECQKRMELVLVWVLRSTYPTLCCMEIRVHVSPKIRVLPSGSFVPTCVLWKLHHGQRPVDRRNVSSN